MAATPDPARSRVPFFFAVGVATALALWLRSWGVTGQVVLDDEWHAIHKLATSNYRDIFTTFGLADHSIPLTLLYKAMADTIGLAEGRLRILQILCGVALVPVAAWVAWGATRDRAAATLFAFLVAGAPFLVMWSRFARPYSISLLLTILAVASIWRWREERTGRLAVCAAFAAMLGAWFHPIAGIYPALACLFVFIEDVRATARGAPRPWRRSLGLGVAVAAMMALPLVAPLYQDFEALRGKSGGDRPNWDTYERMLSLVWGGLPMPAYLVALGLSAWGCVATWRRQPALAAFLAVLALGPAVFFSINGAVWIYQGQNFLRYQLPLLPLILFLGCAGTMDVVGRAARGHGEALAWTTAFALAAAYLALTPAIQQVARLGTWYAHLDHHWDYRHRFQEHKRQYPHLDPPDFYRQLGALAQGTIIEAPFVFEAPYNPLVYYATFHHQREIFGMIHDLCQQGSERIGEVPPNDRRFRFRRFVDLGNPRAVAATGARYLIFNRDLPTRFAPYRDTCIATLAGIYGPPREMDARVVVWELPDAR
jgi:hypothetical protein